MESKTISYLNSKIWYRFLKIVFGFFALLSIVGLWVIVGSEGFQRLDYSKTLIYCILKKDNRVINLKESGVYLLESEVQDGFDYKEYFKGYNDYNIKKIFEVCGYTEDADKLDIFARQKFQELGLNNKEIESISDSEWEKVQTVANAPSYDKGKYLNYSVKMFDIKPVFTYTESIKFLIVGHLSIFIVFEVMRRIFYYIALGTVRPKK